MGNKFKLILIAVELFALLVLLLLGVGCQQRWIIITGDGPRFDWYALVETQPPTEDLPEEPSSEQETSEPETSETTEPVTEPPRPVVTTPPETSEPETTEPESSEPEESTEETTDVPESSATVPTDNWETDEF